MIKALKFYIMTVIIGFIILFLSILLIHCNGGLIKDLEIHENGYFQYVVVGEYSRIPNSRNKPVLAIVGFTTSGLEQEIIEIPREIDGKEVWYIGYEDQVAGNYYYIYSENLKKIYIYDNIKKIENFESGAEKQFENGKKVEKERKECCVKQVNIMLCSINTGFSTYNIDLIKEIYFYKSMIDKINISGKLSPANIVFINNYEEELDEKYYRLDNIGTGETISEPPKPVRNGYEFIGWYTESECINAWDFNVSPVIEEGSEFKLYAAWRSS